MCLELSVVADFPLSGHFDFGEGPYFGFQMILESLFLRDVLRFIPIALVNVSTLEPRILMERF